ncbi:MAG: ATP-binding protein [Candidatus Riflebacteria bacterium]
MLKRYLLDPLLEHFKPGKAIILLGPRQCGKTTLLKMVVERENEPFIWWNGDEPDIRAWLPTATSARLRQLIGRNRLLIIDEAQRIENIGLVLKLIVDNLPEVKVIASGSSSFDLANRINEPLTGRKFEFLLLPMATGELVEENGELLERRMLNHRLIFGCYPEIVLQSGKPTELINQLADSYLYKDILTWERVFKPERLEKLLQALAFQVGSQVSYNEIGQICGLDKQTVERYVSLLEKAFIVFKLTSFSRNLRNELKKSRKIYFYDNGIRNAVIKNFNEIELRQDTGILWENFCLSERIKKNSFIRRSCNNWFWRTTAQQEIDYLEEYDGGLHAYEFKFGQKNRPRVPVTFYKAYPENSFDVITPENYQQWLGLR